MFFAVILVATYILNFFFSFSNYLPKFYEPKDLDRELLLRKLDQTGSPAAPAPPPQNH
jgi:hypothetical protein